MGDKKAEPPKLPKKAPKELKEFVACKRMKYELDPTASDWIDIPVIGAPKVTLASPGADKVDVTLSKFDGYVKYKIPASVSGGQLKVDSTELPETGGVKKGLDDWVKQLNDSIKANGKELEHLEIKDGKLVVTKKVLGAAAPAKDGATTTPTPTPAPDPKKGGIKSGPAKVAIGVGAVLLLGAGAFALTRDDDSPTSAVSPVDSPAPSDDGVSSGDGGAVGNTTPASTSICGSAWTPNVAAGTAVWTSGINDPCTSVGSTWPMIAAPGAPFQIAVDPTVAISHDGSVADVVTGRMGPSQATYQFFISMDNDGTVRITTDCGGEKLTGESPVVPNGPTTVSHPLFQYGPCTVDELIVTPDAEAEARMWKALFDMAYEVTSTPVAQSDAARSFPLAAIPESSYATLSALANTWLEPGCIAASEPSVVVVDDGSCATSHGGVWSYTAAPMGNGAPIIYSGGMLGTDDSWSGPDLGQILFGEGVFPCGGGQVAITACPEDDVTPVGNDYAVINVVLPDSLPTQPKKDERPPVQIEVGSASSSAGSVYSLEALGGAWIVRHSGDDATSTAARALVRDNSVTFVIPAGELPDGDLQYQLTIDAGDSGAAVTEGPAPLVGMLVAHPPAGDEAPPPSDTAGSTEPSAPATPETPESFFAALSESIASGDLTFALDRLHPAVTDAYSEEACRTALASRSVPGYEIAVVAVGDTEPFTYAPPGEPPVDVGDALSVTVTVTGIDGELEGHIQLVDATYRWFTACT